MDRDWIHPIQPDIWIYEEKDQQETQLKIMNQTRFHFVHILNDDLDSMGKYWWWAKPTNSAWRLYNQHTPNTSKNAAHFHHSIIYSNFRPVSIPRVSVNVASALYIIKHSTYLPIMSGISKLSRKMRARIPIRTISVCLGVALRDRTEYKSITLGV